MRKIIFSHLLKCYFIIVFYKGPGWFIGTLQVNYLLWYPSMYSETLEPMAWITVLPLERLQCYFYTYKSISKSFHHCMKFPKGRVIRKLRVCVLINAFSVHLHSHSFNRCWQHHGEETQAGIILPMWQKWDLQRPVIQVNNHLSSS